MHIPSLRLILAGLCIWLTASSSAQMARTLYLHRNSGVTEGTSTATIDSIGFNADYSHLLVYRHGTIHNFPLAEIDSMTLVPEETEISVDWSSGSPRVRNPHSLDGVTVTVGTAGDVTIRSTVDAALTYRLSGSGKGSFKLYSVKKQELLLDNLCLQSPDSPAINIQSKKKTTLRLLPDTENSLTDGKTYTAVDAEDMKATLFSEGQIVIGGEGRLELTSTAYHALCSDDYLQISGGTLVVNGAGKDGLHANDYILIQGGHLTVTGTTGDCVDAGTGYFQMEGGEMTLAATTADTKAVKCDSTLTVSGGTMHVTLSGAQTKGLKSAQHIELSGGILTFECSGGVVVTDGNPSYTTAVKSDGTLSVSEADLTITHTGAAGKGLSSDGDMMLSAGRVEIKVTGDGATYTNTSNQSDTYCATCIKCDGNLSMPAGTYTLTATGKGGKCISVDGSSVYGTADGGPTVSATTSGSKISSSNTGGGGNRPGGWGGWGGQSSGSGGNPKAIKSEGNLTVNGGHLTVSTSQDGGEGLESKAVLTVKGGLIEGSTYDDVINAGTSLVINGGSIYAYASDNDGIDSNGTISISGGVIVSSGTKTPEEGFDCDQNRFAITGGVLVGVGGATSTPTSSACTQRAVVYSGSGSSDVTYTVCHSSTGEAVLSFTLPRTYSQLTMLFSSPLLEASTSYTIYQGGTLTGGTSFHGLTTGHSYTAGTAKKTFTTSSMVTTVR